MRRYIPNLLLTGFFLSFIFSAMAADNPADPNAKGTDALTTDTVLSFQSAVLAAVHEREQELGCRIGLSFQDKDLGLHVEQHGDVLFHPASTMKVAVMIEVIRQSEEGKFSLNDAILVDPMCESMIDGSPYEVDSGEYLATRIGEPESILRLVEEMIQISDNLATNLLIELCGTQKITAGMRRLGATRGFVIRALQDEEAYQAGISNRLTPNELTLLMEAIDRDTAASPEGCDQIRRILLGQKHRDLIPALLPPEARVANKTGSITGNRHDTAIVYAPFGTWYLTIMIDGLDRNDNGAKAAAEISRAIWDEREKI